MRFLLCIVAVFIFGHGRTPGAERHLFILSGQSNMDGLKADKDFTPELRRLLPGREVVVVQDDERAQALRRWVAEWAAIATRHGFEDKKPPKNPDGDLYDRLIKAVRASAQGQFDSVTFIWMQGESDAMLSGYVPAYKEAFASLVAKLQKEVKASAMQVVVGRLSDFQGDDKPNWKAMRELQVAYATENPRSAWVDTDDLNDKEKDGKRINDLHLTPEGYQALGQRFARQAARLILRQAPDAKGRPE